MANPSDRLPYTSVLDKPSSESRRPLFGCIARRTRSVVVGGVLAVAVHACGVSWQVHTLAWGGSGASGVWAGVPGEALSEQELLDRILAIVDGSVIMHSDVRAFIDLGLADVPEGPDQEAGILTYLIERRLVLDRVDRFVVAEPSADAVERGLETVRRRFSTEAEVVTVLERVGLTFDDLRQLLADEIRRETYLDERFASMEPSRRGGAISDWVAGLVERAHVTRTRAHERPGGARD